MGKRGPPPKSAELESAQGFPGRRKRATKTVIKASNVAAEPSDDDLQDDVFDSRFVQPPSYLIGKHEKAVWAEIMSGPNAKAWFKHSDHRVIARYVQLTVAYERLTKSLPAPTYEVSQVVGGKVVGQLIKRNPAFDEWLALSRELRSIEQLIAGNPNSRLSLEKGGLAKPKDPGTEPGNPKPEGRPSGPVGVLKTNHKIN